MDGKVKYAREAFRCCGPACEPPPPSHGDAYSIGGQVYVAVGLHRGTHQSWICLENVETGERRDIWDTHLASGLDTGEFYFVPPMQALARASK